MVRIPEMEYIEGLAPWLESSHHSIYIVVVTATIVKIPFPFKQQSQLLLHNRNRVKMYPIFYTSP